MKLVLSLAAALVSAVSAADWAVIVAGSNTYSNYRHQADACHAYQITKDFGIPDERIILMAVDDVAPSKENPYPGKLFNKPTKAGTPGVDVRDGCMMDYTGDDVTVENFIAVVTGDASATDGKPVLESTSDDRVFINFIDHGGPGDIYMPNFVPLSSKKLIDALTTMHDHNMYSKLVFYLEACESGSMFKGLLKPELNQYALSASNSKESSWGTYCPPDDMVDGKSIGSCLGDLFSVNWMENADKVGGDEKLLRQFHVVKNETSKSHVMKWGDMNFTSDSIGEYMGDASSLPTNAAEGSLVDSSDDLHIKTRSAVAVPDIEMHLAYYRYLRSEKTDKAARKAARAELHQHLFRREVVDNIFEILEEKLPVYFAENEERQVECGACCRTAYKAFDVHCGGFDDYSRQFKRSLVDICDHGYGEDVLVQTLQTICGTELA